MEGSKKNLNINFSKLTLTPPLSKCKLFDKKFQRKNVGVPKLLLLLSELTETHSCVKEIHFVASFQGV